MNDKRLLELAIRGIDREIEALRRERAALSISPVPTKKAAAIKTRRKAAGRG